MYKLVAGTPAATSCTAALPRSASTPARPKASAGSAVRTAAVFLFAWLAASAAAGEIRPYNPAQFDQLTHAGKPVLVAVHASWCPTCRAQRPIIEALMAEPAQRDVTTLVIDFDAGKAWLPRFKVGVQSTLIAYRGTREVGRSIGDTTRAGIAKLIAKTEE